jgi:hypothetical protein
VEVLDPTHCHFFAELGGRNFLIKTYLRTPLNIFIHATLLWCFFPPFLGLDLCFSERMRRFSRFVRLPKTKQI